MNLESAQRLFRHCRDRMDTLYQKSVFDEWAVVTMAQRLPQILWYDGSRPDAFVKNFHMDSGPLFSEMEGRRYEVGDFEFTSAGFGSRYDACIRVGDQTYLVCNYIDGSMAEIRADNRWLKAQSPFVELTEKFREDPLVA